jgi:hypothetical protein
MHKRSRNSLPPALLLWGIIVACLIVGCSNAPGAKVAPGGNSGPPKLVQGELGYEEQAVRAALGGSGTTQVQVFWMERVQVPNAPGVSTPAALSALLVMPAAARAAALDTALWRAWNALAADYGSVPINVAIWTGSGTDLADLWYRANQPEVTGWTRGQIWQAPARIGSLSPALTIAGATGVAALLAPAAAAAATQLAQGIVAITRAFGTQQVAVSLQYGLALLQLPGTSANEAVYHALQAASMAVERARPVMPRQPFTIVAITTPPDLHTFNPAAANLGQAVLATVNKSQSEVTIVAGDVAMKALVRADGAGIY